MVYLFTFFLELKQRIMQCTVTCMHVYLKHVTMISCWWQYFISASIPNSKDAIYPNLTNFKRNASFRIMYLYLNSSSIFFIHLTSLKIINTFFGILKPTLIYPNERVISNLISVLKYVCKIKKSNQNAKLNISNNIQRFHFIIFLWYLFNYYFLFERSFLLFFTNID